MKDIKNRNIYKTLRYKFGVFVVSTALLLTAFAVFACPVWAQRAEKAEIPKCESALENKTSADDTGDTGFSQDDIRKVAENWADAVKNRAGKAQYALMTKALKASVFDEFEALNWVTGTSSPWVESYSVHAVGDRARVTFRYRTSTGPAGVYTHELTFAKEDGAVKISSISKPVKVGKSAVSSDRSLPGLNDLIRLLGMTKSELTKLLGEQPVTVDEGGLGFEKLGIRVWFDAKTNTTAAQVLIMNSDIDINGLRIGGLYSDFKKVFGKPLSDKNGDAHFKYGGVFLSVVRDTATDKVIAVYILKEDF